jgi:altronate dehydratase small subunit
MERQKAFQIDYIDNVATALMPLEAGRVLLSGNVTMAFVNAEENIPMGHKIALRDIGKEEAIIKYGIVIGRAKRNITKGTWVHLHCMKSIYDERSSHMDAVTGVPEDIRYE